MEFHVIELPKLSNELTQNCDALELWAKFINSEQKEELDMLAENLPEDTVSKLTELSVSDVTALAKDSRQQEMHVTQRTVVPQRV